MTLHIFNPDHDLALAANTPHYIAPNAARLLRREADFLPALWAAAGDLVLVSDEAAAQRALQRLGLDTPASWITPATLPHRLAADGGEGLAVEPWGWNTTLCHELLAMGVAAHRLPSAGQLASVRAMSHRGWAARHLLPSLRTLPGTVGEAHEARSAGEVVEWLRRYRNMVIKMPWSSSGRGLRYVFEREYGDTPGLTPHVEGWVANAARRQGCVMVEPYYNKVADFGMEFEAKPDGTVDYLGLSVFDTVNGAYTGSVVDEEPRKEATLACHVPMALLHEVARAVCRVLAPLFGGCYAGPFGVDMMVVDDGGRYLLHPCVELNLRRTMGHVALALARRVGGLPRTMRIAYDGHYRLEF